MAMTYDSNIVGVTTDISTLGWIFFVNFGSASVVDSMHYRYFIPAVTGIVETVAGTTYSYELTFAED